MAIPPQPPTNLLGHTIGPGYRLVALLDATGHAAVYRAWDHTAERYVAVKVARAPADAAVLERLQRDVLTFCEPALPNVAAAIESGIHGGHPYVVLPYLAGGTLQLRRPMKDDRPLRAHPSLLHAWLPLVAKALDAMHECGFVHGAISPATILFDHTGQPAVSDWRLAAAALAAEPTPDPATALDDHVARRHYLCPQRLHGLPLSPASDQYALAAVVYEYLTTKAPFEGATAADVAASQAAHAMEPLKTLSRSLPDSLAGAVHKGLAHAPHDRHESCAAFAARVLAEIPALDIPRKTRLLCPACRNLIAIEPEAAGREGTCLTCAAPIMVDPDLRCLVAPSDRRADLPVAGAATKSANRRRRWIPLALTALAAAGAGVWFSVPPAEKLLIDQGPAKPDIPPPQPHQHRERLAIAELDGEQDDDHAPVAHAEPPLHEQAQADLPPQAPQPQPQDAAPPAQAADALPNEVVEAVKPMPAAEAKQPNAADIEAERVRQDLQGLHAKRRQLVTKRDQEQAIILDSKAILTSSERIVKTTELQQKELQREQIILERSVMTNPALLQQSFIALTAVERDIADLRGRIGAIDNDLRKAKVDIQNAENNLAKIETESEALRREWIACLNPLERDETVAVKIKELSNEMARSVDFLECRLYRALLHILTGNQEAARRDLALFEKTPRQASDPLLGSTAIDFVYANLMVGNGPAARRCLLDANKHFPNDPVLQHIQALCEMAESNFSGARDLFRKSLRSTKKGPPRDRILLCSDAAWLFAACPSDQVRNRKLAEDYADEAIANATGKVWQAWRARAVLHADAGEWEKAKECIEEAQRTAPLVLAAEIEAQLAAIAAQQPYRFSRPLKR